MNRRLTTLASGPALAAAMLLTGCGDGSAGQRQAPLIDPAIVAAFWSPLMVDPGLSGLDRNAAVVSADDLARVAVPLADTSPEAAAVARREAVRLAGGKLTPAPGAPASGAQDQDRSIETAAQIAAAAGPGAAACAGGVEYSARWAALLPEPLAIYPRGAVQEAAGSDRAGCRLRVVGFVTAVEPVDVIDFYYTRVRAGGYDARHRLDGETHVMTGRSGGSSYMIRARNREAGGTEVELVSSGG